jgi:UDP-glucose 4-epimerase
VVRYAAMATDAPQTLLVTGGAGFIGSHLVDAFAAAGHRVIVLDDFSSGRVENLPEGVEIERCDVRAPEAARLIATLRPDALVHHAAQMELRRSVEDPAFDAQVNILGSLNLLEACREAGVRQVIFASTGGAIYGEQESFPAAESHPTRPLSPYGVAKLAVEHYLYVYHHAYGLDVACLRYANVYGERQNPHGEAGVIAIFLDRLLSDRRSTIHGDGLQTRDYVHVADVVRANLAVLGRPGYRVYNVGTGIEATVVELYDELRRAVGSALAAEHGPAKKGEQRRSVIDPAKARRELGLPAPLTIAEGLPRTVEWFRGRVER